MLLYNLCPVIIGLSAICNYYLLIYNEAAESNQTTPLGVGIILFSLANKRILCYIIIITCNIKFKSYTNVIRALMEYIRKNNVQTAGPFRLFRESSKIERKSDDYTTQITVPIKE